MRRRFRSLGVACLFFAVGVVSAVALEMLVRSGNERGAGAESGTFAEVPAFLAVEAEGTTLATEARDRPLPPPQRKRNRSRTVEEKSPGQKSPVQEISRPVQEAPRNGADASAGAGSETPVKDPATRIEELSYTAIASDQRYKRIMAVYALGQMAEKGDESGQISAALAYAMASQDKAVAARARSLYNRMKAAE